jgi:YidC/Oxa1 family membrane protein insertase
MIEFQGSFAGRTITKTFSFEEGSPYTFNLKIKVEGKTDNLWLLSGIPEVELVSNSSIPELKYRTLKGTKNVIDNISLPKNLNSFNESYVDWISNSNGFFGIIIDSLDDSKPGYKSEYIFGNNIPTRLSLIDASYNLYSPSKYPGYEVSVPISSEGSYRIVAAPYQDHLLKALDKKYTNPATGANPDYFGVKKIKGWFSFLSEPFAKLLLIIMRLFYVVTHSWGFSIILLTVVFRIMLYPLNSWSIKSTLKMQEVAPLLKVIDAKYKKDPKKANAEKMKLFKDKGTNPASGCLPILIQLPFLLGMFNLLKSTFELRGASFIPHWIEDLSSPDVLFSWKYPIPLIGTQFHLLPIALGVVMFVQSMMNMKAPADKSQMTDQEKQQQVMMWLMPVLFTVLFYKAASGLNIYFFFSMLLGILQQWYMTSKFKGTLLIRKK